MMSHGIKAILRGKQTLKGADKEKGRDQWIRRFSEVGVLKKYPLFLLLKVFFLQITTWLFPHLLHL